MSRFRNFTGMPLIVQGAEGSGASPCVLVPPGQAVALSPKKTTWAVAFAQGARPFGFLHACHALTKRPHASTDERASPQFTIDCVAEGFVASRLPSPTP